MKSNNFTQTTIFLVAIVLTACQPMPTTQDKLVSPVSAAQNQLSGSELHIDLLDKDGSPVKLTVDHAGQYQIKVRNTSSSALNITFSNRSWFDLKPGEQISSDLNIPESGLTFVSTLTSDNKTATTGEILVNN